MTRTDESGTQSATRDHRAGSWCDVDQLELQSARRALRVFHQRLTPEDVLRLLEQDLKSSDEQWRIWADVSAGRWRPCMVDIAVAGLTKADFLQWWSHALDDLHGVMYPAFPEHYLFHWESGSDGERLVVVEELDHVPFRMYCSYGPEWAPAEPLPGYEPISTGVGRLADGTDVIRFFSQVREAPDSLHLHVGMYVVSAAPDSVVAAHQEQLLVEWTRWAEMARRSVADQKR